MRGKIFAVAILLASTAAPSVARGDARAQAIRLFDRLAGIPIRLDDPRLAQMTAAIEAGDLPKAAGIATDDPGFYNHTLRHFATPLSNADYDYMRPLNDFITTFIGVVRDNRDARTLLNGDFVYRADAALLNLPVTLLSLPANIQDDVSLLYDNTHYRVMANNRTDLKAALVPTPQKAWDGGTAVVKDSAGVATGFRPANPHPDAAGLLTTQQWGLEHLSAGTNRRSVQYAFEVFLCKLNTETRDTSRPDARVRQDVDRLPGGLAATYQTSCRGCHASMDALAGAFAYTGYNPNDRTTYYKAATVQAKYLINNKVFANGYRTTNDSWINHYTENQNAALGWDGSTPLSGNGMKSLGGMLANSQAFAACMSKRVFTEVCRRDPEEGEAAVLQGLATRFVSGGYKLKRLFEEAAAHKGCLGD